MTGLILRNLILKKPIISKENPIKPNHYGNNLLIPQENPKTICDGLLTSMGETRWPIIRDHVERIFTVEDRDVETAMSLIYEGFDMIVEPSGAISLAAVLSDEFRKLENIKKLDLNIN